MSSQTMVTIGLGLVEIGYFSIMSRLLSREDFGLFAAISAVTVVFQSISDAGIGSALIQRKVMTDEYKNTAFSLSFAIGAVVSLVMAMFSGVLADLVVGPQLHVPLMLMALTIFIHGMTSVNFSWMRRNLQFLRAGAIHLVSLLLSSAIAIYMAWRGYGFYAIVFRAIAGALFTLIISYWFVGTRFRFQLKREYVRSIVNFGGWLTASVIIHNISSQIDRLLMTRLFSVETLGAYNRPKEFIIGIGARINGIFDTALFPVLSSIQDKMDSMRNAFNQSQYLMNICSMGLSLAFICNAELLIRIFFGDNWIDLRPLFQIISLSLIFNINGRLGDCYLRSLGLVRQQFFLRSFELVLDVVCILIGFHFGVMGVAVGYLVANVTLIALKTIYLARRMNIPYTDVMQNVVGGWAYGLYFLPLILAQYLIIPSTLAGNIVVAMVFICMMALLLLVFPSLMGQAYKKYAYAKVVTFFQTKFHRK